jgi:predicted nucleic acid-binding protein
MWLIDTNVWLERLLDQQRSGEVALFLERIPSDRLWITDFSFHSIGVILDRLGRPEILLVFVQDMFMDSDVSLVRLEPEDTQGLVNVMKDLGLDFDDAYQYVCSEKYNLTIVSFDGDFDGTERGRKTPAEIVG